MNQVGIRILRRLGILDRISFLARTCRGSRAFDVPIVNGLGLELLADSEPWMTPLLESILQRRRGAFIDVGVNVGQTLLRAKAIAGSLEYVGFEPNAHCVAYVSDLIRVNRFVDCTIVPVGLFTSSGLVSLQLPSGQRTDSSGSIIPAFRAPSDGATAILAPVMDLASVARAVNLDRVAAVKIDVEGAELEVLQTLEPAVLATRPPILVEVLPVYSAENEFRLFRQRSLEDMVGGWRYRINRIRKSKSGQFEGLEPIEALGVHSNLAMCDYLLEPL